MNYLIRPATLDDMPFLWRMLYEAAYPLPELRPPPPFEEFEVDGYHDRYLTNWGRAGDVALIAESATEALGAAWFRLFSPDQHAWAYLGADVPELSIAVTSGHRGEGIGGALLTGLIEAAARLGYPALSLSVAGPNPAQHLYERLGFQKLSLNEGSWTMSRQIP